MTWLLENVLLTLNVTAAGLAVASTVASFAAGKRSYALWTDRAPWLPILMATLFAIFTMAFWLVIYWLGYWLIGFPAWMRWLVG